ncbi:MAG: hypothetical protein C0623_09700 [Desulfuromonas sp.]|nr:MAG: hypothetical protein C0623_09700 [Desulfuromonas sp.]
MDANSLIGKGTAALGKGDAAKAVDFFRKAKATSGYSAEVEMLLAEALEASGQIETAVDVLRVVTEKSPEEVDARYSLGDLLFEMNLFEQAR